MRFFFLALPLVCVGTVQAEWFLHRTTNSNSSSNLSYLPRHLVDDPAQTLFLYPVARLGSRQHPADNLGLWFSGRWSPYIERWQNTMAPGREFAVYVAEAGDDVFQHQHVAVEQDTFKRSYLDHPSLNGHPEALLFLTHNWEPTEVYNDQFSPVAYDASRERWFIHGYIRDDEFTDIPANAVWNVLVTSASDVAFIHHATGGNTAGKWSELDHPMLNDNPDALVLVTTDWSGGPSEAEFSQTQVRYDDTTGRWGLESLTTFDLRTNTAFHILVSAGPVTPEPTITVVSSPPQQVAVEVPTLFGYTYQLEASVDLETFYPEGLPFPGNGEVRSVPSIVALPAQHYRIARSIGTAE